MRIATYEADDRPLPSHHDMTWQELVSLVTTHQPTPCTGPTCRGSQCPHKKVAAWSPVVIDGHRLNANVRAVTALVVDLDHLEATDQDALGARLAASGVRWCLASSHQHTAASPRYRLVLELDRPVTPEEYPRLRRSVLRRLEIPGDPRTGDLSRIYYLPTSRADCPPEAGDGGRHPLAVDAELAQAPPEPEPDLPARDGGPGAWLESTQVLTRVDAERLLAALRALPQRGQGHGTTFLAFSLIFHDFGLGVQDGWPFLAQWSEGCGLPHSPAELERQYYRCAARHHDHPRGWRRGGDLVAAIVADLTRPHEGSWEALLAEAASQVAAHLGTTERSAPEPLGEPYEVLAERPIPSVEWLVDGLLKRGGVAVLGGRSKIGKSWILTSLAVAVAAGARALGSFAVERPRRVFYFYAEDVAGDVRAHSEAILRGMGLDRAALAGRWTVQPQGRFIDVTRDEDVALVVASVRRHGGADLVILEPLRDLHSAQESDADAMAPVMRRLALIGTLLGGATVMVAQHETKPGQNADRKGGERLRGSGVIYASATEVISVTPVAKTSTRIETLVEVEIRGARSPDDFGLVVEIEDDSQGQSHRATWTTTKPRAADADAAAVEAALKNPGDAGVVLAEIERHALATRPELARWRERGCNCPAGSVIHARDLYSPGAHKLDLSRARQRAALASLLAAGTVQRAGGEHGELTVGPERLAALARELR